MVNQTPTYQKLPGKKKSFLMGIHRLWVTEDHLLQVHSRVGTEHYQRFYFKDIQAVMTRKTVAGKIYNGLLGAMTLILLFPAINLDGAAAFFFYCMAALFFIILVANWQMGPTCQTRLRTAVQQEALPSLHRLKTAARVMNQLKLLIQAEQGRLTRESMLKGMPQIQNRDQKPAGATQKQAIPTAGGHDSWRPKGRLHIYLMTLFFARSLLGLSEFYFNHLALTVVDMGIFLTLFILAIVFLVRQYDPPRHTGMLVVAWSAVAYGVMSAISGYAMFIAMAFKDPNAMFNQWQQIERVALLSPNDNAVLLVLQLFFVAFATLLGASILIISRSQQTGLPDDSAELKSNLPHGSKGRI